MATDTQSAKDSALSDLAQEILEGVPLVFVEDEEPTVPLPYETNRQVSEGKLR